MYRSNVPATVAARMAGVRGVWCQVHNVNTWETPRQLAVDRFLCRWRSGMVAVSEQVRRDVIERLQLPPERVRLVYNGVDLSRYGVEDAQARGAARAQLRSEAETEPDEVVLLMVARLVEQKRPQDFIDLAGRIMEREMADAARPRARFWIVGDGPARPTLEERIRALPAPDRVRLWGRRDDVERFLAAADLFVMPSTREGFSNALLEAMAAGLAPIATDVGGNSEAVRHERDGLIVAPMDARGLIEAADRLILNESTRRALGDSARRRAHEFSLEAMVRNVERLYVETVARSGCDGAASGHLDGA
jgi:glycosyltransferase involved in cell wall biosynthesis